MVNFPVDENLMKFIFNIYESKNNGAKHSKYHIH